MGGHLSHLCSAANGQNWVADIFITERRVVHLHRHLQVQEHGTDADMHVRRASNSLSPKEMFEVLACREFLQCHKHGCFFRSRETTIGPVEYHCKARTVTSLIHSRRMERLVQVA